MRLHKPILELVRRASTQLPADVLKALQSHRDREERDTPARSVLDALEKNVRLARRHATPVCQDTGIPVFSVSHPVEMVQEEIQRASANIAMPLNPVTNPTGTLNTRTRLTNPGRAGEWLALKLKTKPGIPIVRASMTVS